MTTSVHTVEMNGISKSFFGVSVLKEVSFSVLPGEIHALAGENGAGKSTLMKILQGVYAMDAGSIRLKGEEVSINSFQDARKLGIGMVFQEFSLVPELTVAQNIFLDREHKNRFGLFDEKETRTQAAAVMHSLGLDIDVTAKVSSLGRAYQQLTEIAKAIAGDAKILILDEPTASLAKEEVEALFRVLKGLTDRGVSIIYISHRMDEIYKICDRIRILRDGKKIAVAILKEITPNEIISHITGRKDLEMLSHDGKVAGEVDLFVRNGHIPGARNIPWTTFTVAENPHKLKSLSEIEKILAEKKIERSQDIIITCTTGREASLQYVVLKHLLGYPNVRLYEGSWTEYSQSDLPVETGPERPLS